MISKRRPKSAPLSEGSSAPKAAGGVSGQVTPLWRPGRPFAGTRAMVGFGAGAFSHLLFQAPLGELLYAVDALSAPVLSLQPTGPLGVPATVNNMFWDGLWGLAYGLLAPSMRRRLGRTSSGLAVGLASILVFWFVVLPLKGQGVAGHYGAQALAVQASFDLIFGLGIAVLYTGGITLCRRKPTRLWRTSTPQNRRLEHGV